MKHLFLACIWFLMSAVSFALALMATPFFSAML